MNFIKALIKFVPIIILAGLMMSGQDALLAATIAAVAAVIVAKLTEKISFKECMDAAMDSVKNIIVALFILMFAYAMASAFMTTGVGASVVNIALSLGITARTVAVVGLCVTGILSVATGTSWGTFAACAPIFLWLVHIVDPNCIDTGSLLLTTCAIAGGACFGDNIGLISDTTIVSSGIQGVEVVDRIRSQGVWSIICLILAAIVFFVAGTVMGLPNEAVSATNVLDSVPQSALDYLAEERPEAIDLLDQVQNGVALYMIVPLILVIGLAIAGLNTFGCIGAGIVSAYILGLFAGTTSLYPILSTADGVDSGLQDYLNMCMSGFADAGGWVIIMMMWVAAFGGIMGRMKAFEPLANLIVKVSHNVRQLMFCNGILCLAGNAILSDEMAQIVTVGPIIKEITEENVEAETEEDMYKLKLRNATFGDAMGVFGSQLIPWHVYLGFYVGIAANVYPLFKFSNMDFIKFNFMAMIAVASILLLTITGLDRIIPLFGLPKEPAVRLKKKTDKENIA
ncbi:Na+/H+ antiporter NhaC family protein [Ihubacter sp. mB4P-1]|uniref:Na+/H+ antiporter NhaC family protein n=1 Tax=Ihubacter sp. mB4P-1 TaxID=3242370 RepID=UPI00192A2D12